MFKNLKIGKRLLLGVTLFLCLFIFVLQFANKDQNKLSYEKFTNKEDLVQGSIELIEDALEKNNWYTSSYHLDFENEKFKKTEK